MMKLRTVKVAAVVALALSAMGAQAAKTLVYCSEGSPEGFDSARYTAGTTFDASSHTVGNRLVEFERGTTKVVPALATSWEMSADGLTYTFKLRPGVKFHTTEYFKPTRDFNADDVVLTFERQLKKDHPYNKAVSPAPEYPYFGDMGLDTTIKSVEKVDPLTVRFVLNKPSATFLADIALPPTGTVISAEYVNKLLAEGKANELNNAPIGTGAFVFKRYEKDAQIRFAANPTYWGGKQAIDNLIFAITKDSAVRAQKLKANECQVAFAPKPQELSSLKGDPNIKMTNQAGLNVGYLAYNVRHKPFDNRDVRLALSMAINKQAILDAVYKSGDISIGNAAVNPIPPTMWSYNKGTKDYGYDTAKAKDMLAKAGFPNGFETTLWAMPVVRPYNPDAKKMAELIQADWEKIGVKAKIVTYEWGEYLKRTKAGEHDTMLLGWTGDNGDPDNFLYVLLSCDAVAGGNNRAGWCQNEFSDLVGRAKLTSNVKERTKYYMQAQDVFKREAPWQTIAHSVVYVPMRKNVQGFVQSPLGDMIFKGVSLK
ncbi:ABC transporter substrate-binding protein [Leeia sp.]|uniref:ABC transporter substrate-binding protein n=1 Tax=Leeia sp. TaxID=2884678 RepID=UPI0035B4BE77